MTGMPIEVTDELELRLGDGVAGPLLRLVPGTGAFTEPEPESRSIDHAALGGIVGRDPGAWLTLADPVASWHHARVFVQADRWWLQDLGSTNQTLVNGYPTPDTSLYQTIRYSSGTLSWFGARGPWNQSKGLSSLSTTCPGR